MPPNVSPELMDISPLGFSNGFGFLIGCLENASLPKLAKQQLTPIAVGVDLSQTFN